MTGMTRRAWMATLGLAPLAGGLVAWAEERPGNQQRQWEAIEPRELIRRRHFPNVELITHQRQKVRFYDDLIKDKKVVLNLMYVNCEGICMSVTANLVRVQELLRKYGRNDVFFYSITIKPEEDTPEVLEEYANSHHVGPGWLFVTGTSADIELIRHQLRFVDVDPAVDANKSNHIGMVRYGNEPQVRWAACPGQANPEHIARTMLWDLG